MQAHTSTLEKPSETISTADDPIMTTAEVAARLRMHKGSIYRKLREDRTFPKPFNNSDNRLGWFRSNIEAYVKAKAERGYQPRPQLKLGEKLKTKGAK